MDLCQVLKLGIKLTHQRNPKNRVKETNNRRAANRDKDISKRRQISDTPLKLSPEGKMKTTNRKELLQKWKEQKEKRKAEEKARQKPRFKVCHVDEKTYEDRKLPTVSGKKKDSTPSIYKFASSSVHKFGMGSTARPFNFEYGRNKEDGTLKGAKTRRALNFKKECDENDKKESIQKTTKPTQKIESTTRTKPMEKLTTHDSVSRNTRNATNSLNTQVKSAVKESVAGSNLSNGVKLNTPKLVSDDKKGISEKRKSGESIQTEKKVDEAKGRTTRQTSAVLKNNVTANTKTRAVSAVKGKVASNSTTEKTVIKRNPLGTSQRVLSGATTQKHSSQAITQKCSSEATVQKRSGETTTKVATTLKTSAVKAATSQRLSGEAATSKKTMTTKAVAPRKSSVNVTTKKSVQSSNKKEKDNSDFDKKHKLSTKNKSVSSEDSNENPVDDNERGESTLKPNLNLDSDVIDENESIPVSSNVDVVVENSLTSETSNKIDVVDVDKPKSSKADLIDDNEPSEKSFNAEQNAVTLNGVEIQNTRSKKEGKQKKAESEVIEDCEDVGATSESVCTKEEVTAEVEEEEQTHVRTRAMCKKGDADKSIEKLGNKLSPKKKKKQKETTSVSETLEKSTDEVAQVNTPESRPSSSRKSLMTVASDSGILINDSIGNCSIKSVSPSFPSQVAEASDDDVYKTAPATPDMKLPAAAYISPFVTMSRGKDRARKEYRSRLSKGGVCDFSPEATGPQAGAAYFTRLLNKETERIKDLCHTWTKNMEDNDLPEEACNMINTALGQSGLLLAKRMQQFSRMIDSCRAQDSDPLITCMDLHGYWDMLMTQVKNLDDRFDNLVRMSENNWEEVLPVNKAPVPAPVVKQKVVKRPARKAAVKAGNSIRDAIKAARKKMKADEDSENVFNGGFFIVKSPSKVIIEKTPKKERKSLLQTVLTAEKTKKSLVVSSPGFAIYSATRRSKSIGQPHTEVVSQEMTTPVRSILKSRKSRKSTVKKAVIFNAESPKNKSYTIPDEYEDGNPINSSYTISTKKELNSENDPVNTSYTIGRENNSNLENESPKNSSYTITKENSADENMMDRSNTKNEIELDSKKNKSYSSNDGNELDSRFLNRSNTCSKKESLRNRSYTVNDENNLNCGNENRNNRSYTIADENNL